MLGGAAQALADVWVLVSSAERWPGCPRRFCSPLTSLSARARQALQGLQMQTGKEEAPALRSSQEKQHAGVPEEGAVWDVFFKVLSQNSLQGIVSRRTGRKASLAGPEHVHRERK